MSVSEAEPAVRDPAASAIISERSATGRKRVAEPVTNRVRLDGKFFRLGDAKWYIKGFTYGPFEPNADGDPLPDPEQTRRDFVQMRDGGANCVRVYHIPPGWLMALADELGMKLLVDVAWPKNQAISDREVVESAKASMREAAERCGNHPAVFALSIANEIPADMVRFMRAKRISAFLDDLVAEVKAIAPACLVTFANFPSTEYLTSDAIDFVTYNVYLHEPETFRRYLARLQHIAGEKPLVLGEYGVDTFREADEQEQADRLGQQLAAMYEEGLAGGFVFAFTDDWFTHGYRVDDWLFGCTRAEVGEDGKRIEKPAFAAVADAFRRAPQTADIELPKISVIVCSYNGASTVESCLASMERINYPDYEVVFVDDGSTDHTQDILAKFPWVRNIKQTNKGLSVARNVGMEAAEGEIIVYTDSDCEADEDWLYQIALHLTRSDHVGIGGPNLIPDEGSWVADCVGLSPGGPTHVMIDDRTAEHVPGCNMAFYRWAALDVGGFDSQFRKAGDDVDFIWRLQNAGGSIGFASAAQVWHYRRNSIEAYLKQQRGYGEAEALLKFKHPDRFNTLGSAHWRGRIYGADIGVRVGKDVIYHGVWGTGLFQTIYRRPVSLVAQLLQSVEWHLLTAFVFLLSAAFLPLVYVALGMFCVPIVLAIVAAWQAPRPQHASIWTKPLIAYLHWRQPITRGAARYTVRLKEKELTQEARAHRRVQKFPFAPGDRRVLQYWSTEHDRHVLLERIAAEGRKARLKMRVDSGWAGWDMEIYGSRYVKVQLTSVTEHHAAGMLTRLRMDIRPSGFGKVLFAGSLVLSALLLLLLWPFSRPAVLIPLTWWALFLFNKWKVRGPILGMVDTAAMKAGFWPVDEDARKDDPEPAMRAEPISPSAGAGGFDKTSPSDAELARGGEAGS
ncbi:MAG: glycosyltransferase [Planctomycetota bacterium]